MDIATLYDRTGPERITSRGNLHTPTMVTFPSRGRRPAICDRQFRADDRWGCFVRDSRKSGGNEISGCSADDRFVMGLLRSVADAVLVGSGTLHGDPGHVRTPGIHLS